MSWSVSAIGKTPAVARKLASKPAEKVNYLKLEIEPIFGFTE